MDQIKNQRDSFKRIIDQMHKEISERNGKYQELFLSWQKKSKEYETTKVYIIKIYLYSLNIFTMVHRLLRMLEHCLTVLKKLF